MRNPQRHVYVLIVSLALLLSTNYICTAELHMGRISDWMLRLADEIDPARTSPIDPVQFAQSLNFNPDPWQAEMLRSDARQLLLNCARQSGKSTTTAILALWTAIYRPRSMTLVLSPSLRQSSELFRKVLDFYRQTNVKAHQVSKLSMELSGGSRIQALPGKESTVRGFSGVDLLVVDEAARVPDELYYAIRPMLAVSGGCIVALSTPFGKRGWFFDEWANGGDDWHRIEVPATECPRIPAEFLVQEQRALGDFWFEQEYMCRFQDSLSGTFTYDEIQGMFHEGIEAWNLI